MCGESGVQYVSRRVVGLTKLGHGVSMEEEELTTHGRDSGRLVHPPFHGQEYCSRSTPPPSPHQPVVWENTSAAVTREIHCHPGARKQIPTHSVETATRANLTNLKWYTSKPRQTCGFTEVCKPLGDRKVSPPKRNALLYSST